MKFFVKNFNSLGKMWRKKLKFSQIFAIFDLFGVLLTLRRMNFFEFGISRLRQKILITTYAWGIQYIGIYYIDIKLNILIFISCIHLFELKTTEINNIFSIEMIIYLHLMFIKYLWSGLSLWLKFIQCDHNKNNRNLKFLKLFLHFINNFKYEEKISILKYHL